VLHLTAENGGVVMINFYSGYVVPSAAARGLERKKVRDALEEEHIDDDVMIRAEMNRWDVAHPIERGTIHTILDHIDHIAKVAGVDHIGLGSDYDGISTLPKQLEDVSTYPNITQGLLDRGYSHEDIKKILGGNLLRVLAAAERVAQGTAEKSKDR
jgi:membrane dipeptidase